MKRKLIMLLRHYMVVALVMSVGLTLLSKSWHGGPIGIVAGGFLAFAWCGVVAIWKIMSNRKIAMRALSAILIAVGYLVLMILVLLWEDVGVSTPYLLLGLFLFLTGLPVVYYLKTNE